MKKDIFSKIRIMVLCFLLLFCAFLSSCGSEKAELEIFNSAFCAEVSWRADDVEFVANIEVDSNAERDVYMRVLSPECLRSAELRRKNGTVELSYDKILLGSSACDAYLAVAEMLISDGNFDYKCKVEESGEELLCYSSGERLWYFSALDGRIKRIKIRSKISK